MKIVMAISFMLLSCAGMAFDKIQVGPSLKIIDVPHPAQIGVEARILDGYVGFSIHKGLLPSIKLDEYDVKLNNLDLGVKIHPWKGSFYLGALIGKQKVSVKGNEEVQGQDVKFEVNVDSTYITPHLGWQWRYDSGFYMGLNLGVQLSAGAKTSVIASAQNLASVENSTEYQDAKKDIEDEGNNIGNTTLPGVGLLQIGWMF